MKTGAKCFRKFDGSTDTSPDALRQECPTGVEKSPVFGMEV